MRVVASVSGTSWPSLLRSGALGNVRDGISNEPRLTPRLLKMPRQDCQTVLECRHQRFRNLLTCVGERQANSNWTAYPGK